jgi:hypothetical protein
MQDDSQCQGRYEQYHEIPDSKNEEEFLKELRDYSILTKPSATLSSL